MTESSKPVETPLQTGIPSDNINGPHEKINGINIFYPSYIPMLYNGPEKWSEYIREKWDINITINYEPDLKDLTENPFYESSILYLTFSDYAWYQFNSDLNRYANDGFAYDLSPYYEKYGWDLFIDPDILAVMTDNGRIYAVPAVDNRFIIPRYYNKEYLTTLGLPVPSDINGFYNYLKETKKLNSNDESFYPMCIYHKQITPSTPDIFRAFGAYVNSYRNSTVSYNPRTISFEDAVFSEYFMEALEFMKTLQKEKLLYISGTSDYWINDERINIYDGNPYKLNKDFATEYWYIYKRGSNMFLHETEDTVIEYEHLDGYYLTGYNDKAVCEIKRNISFYVFPKTIKNVGGAAEYFDRVFADERLMPDLKYGIEGVDFAMVNGEIQPKEILAGSYMNLRSIKPHGMIFHYPESNGIMDEIPAKFCFEKNVFNEYHAYLIDNYEDAPHFGYGNNKLLDCLFNKNVGSKDAFEAYINEFNKSGRREFIESLNRRLGSDTSYTYP